MDVAYDHIQEEALSPHSQKQAADLPSSSDDQSDQPPSSPSRDLNTEFQEAFKAVSSSPWGAKLGGFFGQVRKQGESLYSDAQKEAHATTVQASKGFEGLRDAVVSRTRGLSLGHNEPAPASEVPGEEALPVAPRLQGRRESGAQAEAEALGAGEVPENLPADIVKEATSLVASLRITAAAKLKDVQKAEDAADEALLKFGMNVRNFLRDAVTISAPTDADTSKPKSTNEVLFETSEPGTGRKIFHSTRFDAQLHAIHTNLSSFAVDPQSEAWETYAEDFDVERETEAITKDLDKYEELRRAMEKLVPQKVEYRRFWMRYCFLRSAVEEEEKRRKEVLRGAAAEPAEKVAWDDDDEEDDKSTTPNAAINKASESVTTLNAPAKDDNLLKPRSPRRSNEEDGKSVADSDASYDIVSGATSQAPGSPKEEKAVEVVKEKDDSDEEDWE